MNEIAVVTEETTCPLCGGAERDVVHAVSDAVWNKPGTFTLVRCRGCETGYLSPRPSRASIGFFYRDLYDADGLKVEESLQHGWIAGLLNGRRLADLFRRRRPKEGERHLDVGCGTGALVVRVARVTRATSIGTDLDANALTVAERRGKLLPVETHRGTLSEQGFAPGSFATVSMIHFLEHSYEPNTELKLAYELLERGGAIVVEVPSLRSLARRLYRRYWFPHLAPQHVTLFSRASLRSALERAGFADVRVKDCYAPLVWLSSFVLFWHHTLGGRSRFAKSLPMRLFTLLAGILLVPPFLILDPLIALLVALLRHGDHIRATALKP